MQLSPCLRRYFLTFLSILVYGFGIAGITYGLYYYHKNVDGNGDAAVLSVLYIADILCVAFLVVSIVAAFLHVFPLSIISSVVLIIATIINIIIPVILLAKEQVFYDMFEFVWRSDSFNGVDRALEKDYTCCGWGESEERCFILPTCRFMFEFKIMSHKYFICIFFFVLALLAHFAVVLSIMACVEDRTIKIRISNDERDAEDDQLDPNDSGAQNGSDDEMNELQGTKSQKQRNYQPPQINPMPNFLIQKQNKNPDYTYTYEYEEDYEEDVNSDSESR